MVNVLLESYDLTAPFLAGELKKHVRPNSRVAIIAFSFLPEQAGNLEQWLGLYGRETGMFYNWLVEPLMSFGIRKEDIHFVNYFADTKESAAQKIRNADILYFTGGLPDAMMERLAEFELVEILREFDGVVMGCSAGAMMQLAQYHITPDQDYPEFGYYPGIPWLKDFYVEVHYEQTELQKSSIRRVLAERKKPVCATYHNRGAVIVENGAVKLLGETEWFDP